MECHYNAWTSTAARPRHRRLPANSRRTPLCAISCVAAHRSRWPQSRWGSARSVWPAGAEPGALPAGPRRVSRQPTRIWPGPRRRCSPAAHPGAFIPGRDPSRAATIEDLRAMAHRRLPRFVLEYLEGGARGRGVVSRAISKRWPNGAFCTARWSMCRTAISRPCCSTAAWRCRSRSRRPGSTASCGRMPICARAGRRRSRHSVRAEHDVERNDGARRPGAGAALLVAALRIRPARDPRDPDRARRTAGCEALIVTTDAQIYGNREWAKRLHRTRQRCPGPPGSTALMHPRWLTERVLTHGLPRFENVIDFVPKDRHQACFDERALDPLADGSRRCPGTRSRASATAGRAS